MPIKPYIIWSAAAILIVGITLSSITAITGYGPGFLKGNFERSFSK
jgi:hypothetical protein